MVCHVSGEYLNSGSNYDVYLAKGLLYPVYTGILKLFCRPDQIVLNGWLCTQWCRQVWGIFTSAKACTSAK